MNEDQEVQAVIDRAEATEARATDVALQHIAGYAPFTAAAESVDERGISDFERIANTHVVSQSEMIELLGKDIRRYVRALRPKTVMYPQMGAVRLAVLAHVEMVIGKPALDNCRELWDAVSSKRWDDASDALMLTNWPAKAEAAEERRRVLDLARMMRTGLVPLEWLKS